MVNNRPRNFTNPEVQQRERIHNRAYKIWKLFTICALAFVGSLILGRIVQSPIFTQTETTTQFTSKPGCAIFDVDPEINPCDDFYKYACNKWQQQNPRPAWSPEWSVDAIVDESIIKTVIDILEESNKDKDLMVIRQAKELYQKCLLNDGDQDSGDYFINNMWKSLGGFYGRGLQTGEPIPSRKEMCGALIYKHFQFALLHKLLEHKYKDRRNELENIISEVQTMFNFIKDAFKKEKSKAFIESNEDIRLCAGFPQWIFSSTRVQRGYNWVNLNTSQTFREQMLSISAFDGDLFDDRFHDYECNMWYMNSGNPRPKSYHELYLPMRLLMSPFIDPEQPRAINYGTLGTMIASIMASSYIDWRSTPSADCLEKQYSLFTVDFGDKNISLNGESTYKSNLEQNVALQEAFLAFPASKLKGNYKHDFMLSSNNCKSRNQFTNNQLFFLAYAQSWCQTLSKQEMMLLMQRSSQVPSMFHVLVPLQNFKEFTKAWNCPLGSNMNPPATEKCQVL